MHSEGEENRRAIQQLADQQQRHVDGVQTRTRESVGAYMNFMNSMFAFWQGGIQTAEQGAKETEKATKGQES